MISLHHLLQRASVRAPMIADLTDKVGGGFGIERRLKVRAGAPEVSFWHVSFTPDEAG